MNVKAEKFDVLVADIEKSGNTWFTKDVIEGESGISSSVKAEVARYIEEE